jgi:hypothetical protein
LSFTASTLPAADVITIGPAQATVRTLGSGDVPLPELQWLVFAPHDPFGTAVQFTGGPFVHSQCPQFSADCRLSLRLVQGAAPACWQVQVAAAQTHAAARDANAVVIAASQNPGSALLGLQATFVPRPGAPLCAGEYVTRVVGLVTGI